MDEPVPIRRAAIGCVVLAAVAIGAALIVRPAIFSLAPPRDDAAVIIATPSEVSAGSIRRDVILASSRGWSGELDAGNGRVQVAVIVSPSAFGGIAVVNAASPGRSGCGLTIGADRLTDCDGRAWTFEGVPLQSSDPHLERIGVEVVSGSIVLDMTQPLRE